MTIVKHSKDSNSLQSLKKRFRYSINRFLPTLLLASLLGTYLDLYFVGKGLYSFPLRPLPSIFSINIAFTLLGLPVLIGIYLWVCHNLKFKRKIVLIISLSLAIAIGEKLAESMGLFVHTESWKHSYSFFGYSLYLSIIYAYFYQRIAPPL